MKHLTHRRRSLVSLGAFALFAASACGGDLASDLVCAPDEQDCQGRCVLTLADRRHCGSCGRACGPDQCCSRGACIDAASAGGACTTAVVASCFNLDQVRPLNAELTVSDSPLPTDDGPLRFARLGETIYSANCMSGTISAMRLSPASSTTGTAAIQVPSPGAGFSDLENVAVHDGRLFVSNAASGTLVAIDPATGAVTDEIALVADQGQFVNPQGMAFVGSKGFLVLNGTDELVVLDLSTIPGMTIVARLDLSRFAHSGAVAGPSRAIAVGSRVYVTLNQISSEYTTVPGANGHLVVVDGASDAIVGDAIDLGPACINSGAVTAHGETLWIGCGLYEYFGDRDVSVGALVPVDVAGDVPVVGEPIVLQHTVASVAFCGDRGYAGASDSGTVISFDAATRTTTEALVCPAEPGKASFVPDLACAP